MSPREIGRINAIGVIPARYGSSRLPGKPLREILGRPLLSWTIEGAKLSKTLSRLIVATDHDGIASLARQHGVEVCMTSPDLPSGTDRTWAAVKELVCDVVVNIQGDEPLVQGEWIDRLIEAFKDASVRSATLARPWQNKEELISMSTAKVVTDRNEFAIYFSRHPIPYTRRSWNEDSSRGACLKHLGLYGYTKSFLEEYCARGETELEKWEGLEQLRVLYMGEKMKVIQVEFDSLGVDTEEDIQKVSERLGRQKR